MTGRMRRSERALLSRTCHRGAGLGREVPHGALSLSSTNSPCVTRDDDSDHPSPPFERGGPREIPRAEVRPLLRPHQNSS